MSLYFVISIGCIEVVLASNSKASTLTLTTPTSPDKPSAPHSVKFHHYDEDESAILMDDRKEMPDKTKFSAEVWSAAKFGEMKKTDDELSRHKPHVVSFYKNQNDIIAGYMDMEALHTNAYNPADEGAPKGAVKLAINASFAANVVLFIVKMYAAISTGSLAVIASLLDSLLDLLSGSVFFFLHRAMRNRDPYKYPVSKSRLEPVGIIIFAVIMGMTSVQILTNAAEDFSSGFSGNPRTLTLDWPSLGILLFVIATKSFLYFWCLYLAKSSEMVQALCNDHRNDCFTNVIAVAAIVLAKFVNAWYADPTGATVLSLYIIISWVRTGREQIGVLIGQSASPQVIGQIAYLAASHDERIRRVDKVLAYHMGARLLVECDIVLPENMPLKETHDIGEALEKKIEQLPNVERAFVHLDYEWQHRAEHKVIQDD